MNNSRKYPKIAFIVDWLEHSYQAAVLEGAAEVSTREGAQLVALPGGVVGAEHHFGTARNKLYELVTPKSYDGLIVMTGTLGNAQGADVMEAICPDFPKKRVCHIAIDVPGSPSVLVDNTRGTRRLVDHLIRRHGHRRIVFIRGSRTNAEAEARFRAYCDVLDANNITYDERLVVDGDFRYGTTKQRVAALFQQHGLKVQDIDAIVAASDLMAMAALSALAECGFRVPSDIAVVGFDDIEEARHCVPPLSTVRQPLLEQGREAARIILRAIEKEVPLETKYLDTTCYFRRSCGCTAEDEGYITERPKSDTRMTLEASMMRRRDLILDEVSQAVGDGFSLAASGWQARIFDSLLQAFRGDGEAFRNEYDVVLEALVAGGGEVCGGHLMITALRKQLSICAGDSPEQLRELEMLLHDARILTSNAMERAQAQRRWALEREARIVSELSCRLSVGEEGRSLNQIMFEELPRLGLQACTVCRYVNNQAEQAELVASFSSKKAVAESEIGTRFLASELMPSTLVNDQRGVPLVVEPLFDASGQLGFAIFQWGDTKGYMYEILRKVLTVALKRDVEQALGSQPRL